MSNRMDYSTCGMTDSVSDATRYFFKQFTLFLYFYSQLEESQCRRLRQQRPAACHGHSCAQQRPCPHWGGHNPRAGNRTLIT